MTVPLANRIDSVLEDEHHILSTSSQHSLPVVLISALSLISGIAASSALALRMLERKIKVTTRAMIFGMFLQGLLSILTLALFHAIDLRTSEQKYTEAVVYKVLASILSFISGSLLLFKYITNLKRNQVYVWLYYDLSNEQRSLILLLLALMSYISLTSFIYAELERDWAFDISLYWCISTFLTIGFGDFVPKSDIGLAIFPLVTSLGVLLAGATIYSIRNVYLEALAVKLASNYSRFTIIHDGEEEETSASTNRPHEPATITEALDIIHHNEDCSRSKWKRAETDPGVRLGVSLENQILPPPLLGPSSSKTATGVDDTRSGNSSNLLLPPSHILEPATARHHRKKTLHISRSKRLPSVTILAHNSLSEMQITKATKEEIMSQIRWAVLSVTVNVGLSAGLFAYLEGWSYIRGCYFIYCAFMTIGYGDFVLRSYISRSIFIWYIFFAIGSWTYLFSMVSELAFDEWTVETKSIAKRVERYEVKAKWKHLYSPAMGPSKSKDGLEDVEDIDDLHGIDDVDRSKSKGKGIAIQQSDTNMLLNSRHSSSEPLAIDPHEQDAADIHRRRPLAYSVSISRSKEPSFLLRRVRQELERERDNDDMETQPLLYQEH